MRKLSFLIAFAFAAQFSYAQWNTNGNNISNTNTGNVGIGTTTPTVKLDVAGNVNAKAYLIKDNWDNAFQSEDNGKKYHLIGTYRGWNDKAVYIAGVNATNAAGTGYVTATERVLIGNPFFNDKFLSVNLMTGGVGIGTEQTGDPNFRLFVEKGIRTRKVKVDAINPWPDYVFLPSYRLLSLKEVEAFISQHKHLPGVSSASEIEEKGIDVAETQAMLLKKIEELTLYVIEQNKKLEEQGQLIGSLQKELQEIQSKK